MADLAAEQCLNDPVSFHLSSVLPTRSVHPQGPPLQIYSMNVSSNGDSQLTFSFLLEKTSASIVGQIYIYLKGKLKVMGN